MKNLIAVEGKTELYLVNYLIDNDIFFLSRNEIFDERVFHIRQLRDIEASINTLKVDEEINIYRIGDTQKDEYDLDHFKLRKEYITINKICTKPEIEILIIINEDKYNHYLKCKLQPKQYVKIYLPEFANFNDYVASHNIVTSIIKYKELKKHKKDELFLADFIKKE